MERIPHIEPQFNDAVFVAEYSRLTKRYAFPDYAPITRFTLSSLAEVMQPEILELGPGPGWCGILLARGRTDATVRGLDVSETYVAIANENAKTEGVRDRVSFHVGDACQLGDFQDHSFDAVISNQSFHYWDAPTTILDEISRILKPGGTFCIGADRRDLSYYARFGVRVSKLFLTARVRESWMRSFKGSYTLEEAVRIVEQSKLRDNALIKTYPRMFYIQGQTSSLISDSLVSDVLVEDLL